MIHRTAPCSMALNDPYPWFQGHAILWRWISQKRYGIHSFNGILIGTYIHTSYSTVSFRMSLSDLAKYARKWSIARPLCDSRATCISTRKKKQKLLTTGRAVDTWQLKKKDLSCRKQTARQLRTQHVEGTHRPKYYTVTLKFKLRVTHSHWKRNRRTDHTRLTINRVIWR